MPNIPDNTDPLAPFRAQSHALVTICVGAGVGCVGTLVILCTEANSFGHNLISELLVRNVALGGALVLGGSIIAAVGFASWCRGDRLCDRT